MTEEISEDVIKYTTELIEKHKIQAKPLTAKDYAEIKKWIRLANTFPDKVHRYLPKFEAFHDRYWINIKIMEHKEIRRLIFDVYTELEVEPVNDKDFEFVGKGVIETVIRRSKEVKEMADLFINYARQQDAE
jgi:hypothetical protein